MKEFFKEVITIMRLLLLSFLNELLLSTKKK